MMPGRKRNPVDEVRNEWQRFNPQGLAALEFYRSTYHYTPRRSGQGRPRTEDQGDLSCSAFAAAIASFACYCVVNGGARPEQDRRVYRECALQLRYKALKRRVKAKLRDDRKPATRSNDTGAMDFVHDRLAKGHKLRVLAIVDIFSRFSPALTPRFTFRGADDMVVLERACKEVGFPATIRVDQRQRVRVARS